jgi:hypothetical protein
LESSSIRTSVRIWSLGRRNRANCTVYTYGSKLETASPRFTQPGDFFTYIVFVCTVILVSLSTRASFFLAPNPLHLILSALVGLFFPNEVPGNEEDYPYTSAGPSFAINPKGQLAVWAWWEVPLRKLVSIHLLDSGGCDSLHLNSIKTSYCVLQLNCMNTSDRCNRA